jgi:hypothetical protein
MTRSKLKRTLSRTYWLLGLVLVVSLAAKLADSIPGIAGTKAAQPLKDAYEYMKDMSLVFVTVVAAYLANVFQSRSSFIASLREEWRDIIASKSMLFAYTQIERPTQAQYLETFCRLSETIDNMRTVYRNVGETDALIGLYPYSPLHDMRRALQTLEPGPDRAITAEQRRLVRDSILQSFYALRESFLDELDPEQPDTPILIYGGRRLKKPGSTSAARKAQERQKREHDLITPPNAEIEAFLAEQYAREQTTSKPWRELRPDGRAAGAPAGGGAQTLT